MYIQHTPSHVKKKKNWENKHLLIEMPIYWRDLKIMYSSDCYSQSL